MLRSAMRRPGSGHHPGAGSAACRGFGRPTDLEACTVVSGRDAMARGQRSRRASKLLPWRATSDRKKERSEHGGEEDAQMDVEDMPESDLDAGCSAEGDLEGVADVGLRMALSAKLADVVKHNRVHSTPTALPTDTDSQRRKPQRRRKRITKEREEHKKKKKNEK